MVLDLSLVSPDTSVIQSGDSLIASASGAQLQWLDCDDFFIPVSGAVSPIFVPDSSGNYAVQVSENGCIDTSSCYNVVLVGQVEYLNDYEVSLYPIPARDNIQINVQGSLVDQPYYILDHFGKVLSYGILTAGLNRIEISHFTSGIYQIMYGDGFRERFIVIK
jgi:hypothetical protein